MPKQNRVAPDGQIIATEARGAFMGNRGILHNNQQEIVKPFAHKAWIICLLSFKGRQRQVMQPGNYTELFFLDEATALAAGHRPCFECRRPAAEAFRAAWLVGNPQFGFGHSVRAGEMDKMLHVERLTKAFYIKDRKKKTYTAVLDTLPNGTFILWQERPYLVLGQPVTLPEDFPQRQPPRPPTAGDLPRTYDSWLPPLSDLTEQVQATLIAQGAMPAPAPAKAEAVVSKEEDEGKTAVSPAPAVTKESQPNSNLDVPADNLPKQPEPPVEDDKASEKSLNIVRTKFR